MQTSLFERKRTVFVPVLSRDEQYWLYIQCVRGTSWCVCMHTAAATYRSVGCRDWDRRIGTSCSCSSRLPQWSPTTLEHTSRRPRHHSSAPARPHDGRVLTPLTPALAQTRRSFSGGGASGEVSSPAALSLLRGPWRCVRGLDCVCCRTLVQHGRV